MFALPVNENSAVFVPLPWLRVTNARISAEGPDPFKNCDDLDIIGQPRIGDRSV